MFKRGKIAFGRSVAQKTQHLSAALVCSYKDLSAPEMTSLRLDVRRAGGYVQMGSNRVIAKGLHETKFEHINVHLRGSNFTIFFNSSAPIRVISIVNDLLRKQKERVVFKFCTVSGADISADEFKKIARIKSEQQLQAEFSAALFLTARYLLLALSSPMKALVGSMEKYYKSKEGE